MESTEQNHFGELYNRHLRIGRRFLEFISLSSLLEYHAGHQKNLIMH